MAQVSFSKVQKSYGDVEILKSVSLEAKSGEFVVLVGPSGCGKSTLLRMVAGLEDVTGGEIRIGDRVVNDVAPRDRGVAMVFQSYALYPHMTVRENLAFGLTIRKEPPEQIKQRVEEAAKMLAIDAYLDRFPKQLSGGQRQRVAIGRAIVRQPDVFLFDEPLSNLDASLRTQMRVELKKLHSRLKATMIYVTHDQVEAMTLADRIVVMNGGVLQQVGSPAELFEHPINRFVASFIGSPGMNFIKGRVEGGKFVAPGVVVDVPKGAEAAVEMGVRPQHLSLHQDVLDASGASFEIQADVVEPMGWEAHVHGMCGDQHLIAHVRHEEISDRAFPTTLNFYCEGRHLHFFDALGHRINH